MKLIDRMPKVFKAAIKAKAGNFEESENIELFYTFYVCYPFSCGFILREDAFSDNLVCHKKSNKGAFLQNSMRL